MTNKTKARIKDSGEQLQLYIQKLKKLRHSTRKTNRPTDILKDGWKDYLVGFLLMPWIWVWGTTILSGLTLLFLYWKSLREPSIIYSISQIPPGRFTIYQLWQIIAIFNLANYTITFYSRRKSPRLESLLFLLSLFGMLVFLIGAWRYLSLVLI
jgi:hypothetical protein